MRKRFEKCGVIWSVEEFVRLIKDNSGQRFSLNDRIYAAGFIMSMPFWRVISYIDSGRVSLVREKTLKALPIKTSASTRDIIQAEAGEITIFFPKCAIIWSKVFEKSYSYYVMDKIDNGYFQNEQGEYVKAEIINLGEDI